MKEVTGKQQDVRTFTWLMVALGAPICIYSGYQLSSQQLDIRFVLLALLTIGCGSRLTIQMPRAKVHLSVSDAFVFLILLLYGGEAAIIVAAAEALFASLRFKSKGITIRADGILFNCSLMACSTFLAAGTLNLAFGSIVDLARAGQPVTFITALCVMSLVQFAANSTLAAVYTACETNRPIWGTWNRHYLYSSITYFAGAGVSGVMVRLAGGANLFAVPAITAVICIAYLTLRRCINDIKTSALQAEQAEHARAEAERERAEAEGERAEQAERHVKELSHYVAKLERTGAALEQSKEHFRHAAFHDALTGLPNRNLFIEQLRVAFERGNRQGDDSFAVIFLD